MILGLTGGICTGKSVATQVLRALGARVVDCDEISHYLSEYDPAIWDQIHAAFGTEVFTHLGALNRRRLGEVVFGEAGRRLALEAILHPPIIAVVQANIEHARALNQHLVVAVPLLFEAGMQDLLDQVWVVSASRDRQLARLRERSGMQAEAAEKWIEAQMPLERKEQLSDRVLYNNGTIAEFKQLVEQEWQLVVAAVR